MVLICLGGGATLNDKVEARIAASNGNVAKLRELSRRCGLPCLSEPAQPQGFTPMHYAAQNGELAAVAYLIGQVL